MSLLMSAVLLGLTMLVFDICYGLTCDRLPKVEVPGIEIVIASTPFRFDYALTPMWDCTTVEFSRPPRGITSYQGIALNMQGTDLNAFPYTVESDKKTMYATRCSHGEKRVWYLSASHIDDNGGFYCLYTCNNTTLKEFGCASNNNGTSPAELEAVELARQVPNGHQIHNAWENCSESQACNVF